MPGAPLLRRTWASAFRTLSRSTMASIDGPTAARFSVTGAAARACVPPGAVLRASPFPADPKASSSSIFCRMTRSRHPLLLTASNVRAFGRLVPFLLCPLLTPTPRSRTLRYAQSRLRDATQVSRGKFNRLPRAPAGSTVPAPCLRSGKLLMAVDFAVHGPLVRPGRPHIRFLFVGPRVCSTLPLDPASRRRRCALLTLLRHQDG
jgi:hypothetical protein